MYAIWILKTLQWSRTFLGGKGTGHRRLVLPFLFGGTLGYFYVSHLEKVPISGRWRFMNFDEAERQKNNQLAHKALLDEYGKDILPFYHPSAILIKRITSKLLDALDRIPEFRNARKDYQVSVVKSPEANAVVLPGGQIFVFTGILSVAQNDSEIASIIGHEIAHRLLEHHEEKLSMLTLFSWLNVLSQTFIPSNVGIFNELISNLVLMLPNSRKMELEADRMGLYLMAHACFDPSQALDFWTRFDQTNRSAKPAILSTHPSNPRRIRKLKEILPEVQKLRCSICP